MNLNSSEKYGFEKDLVKVIHHQMLSAGLTLACAESCTGGLLSAIIVGEPGSSEYFKGSIVSYHNEVKENLLGVSRSILEHDGAVSSACAETMAKNARLALKTDIALSITGIAGPDGGSAAKPVGTVYIGYASNKNISVEHFIFQGSRTDVRLQSAYTALQILKENLTDELICMA